MAKLPTINGPNNNVNLALDRTMVTTQSIKDQSTRIRVDSLAGTLTSEALAVYSDDLAKKDSKLSDYQVVDNIQTEARNKFNKPAYTMDQGFIDCRAAIAVVIAWIDTNIQKSASDYLESQKLDARGEITLRVMSAGSLTGLVTEIDKLLLTFD